MRIAFIGDQRGKVHHNRYKIFCKHLPHRFDFFTVRDKIKARKYNAIYYAFFPLYRRCPVKHDRIYGSATSWKCIYSKNSKRDVKLLKNFYKVSANNVALWRVLQKYRSDIECIPNGVDSEFFCPNSAVFDSSCLKIGWTGNKDRAEKNYETILRPVRKRLKGSGIQVLVHGTRKSDPSSSLWSRSQMREFYRGLSFFLVVSSYEGTPNPALEAASCGVPIITTKVGNMPELVSEGSNGFFVECKADNIIACLKSLRNLSPERYERMRVEIRNSIKEYWTWEKSCLKFNSFFEG